MKQAIKRNSFNVFTVINVAMVTSLIVVTFQAMGGV